MTEIKPTTRLLVSRLINVFGEPKSPNPQAFMEEFAKAVNPYDARLLQKAGDEIIRRSTFWPKPAEVIEVIDELLQSEEIRSRNNFALDEREARWKKPDPETIARNKALLDSLGLVLRGTPTPDAQDFLSEAQKSQRPGFEEMQRNSKNKGLHTLTETSKRMTGDRDA